MAKAYRKMKFHRLRMYQFTPNSKGSEQKFLTSGQEKTTLCACLKSLPDDERFTEFMYKNKSIAIEFISGVDEFIQHSKGIITGKLSTSKDAHAYQIRTDGTANERGIILNPQERFETRSYFVLDTENMIVGYLHEQSAPSVYSLGDFIHAVSKRDSGQSTVFGSVTDIATSDMIENLSKMAYIGTMTGSFEIPKNLPIDVTGLSQRSYKKLVNQKLIRSSVSLVVDRRGVSAFPIDNMEDPTDSQLKENKDEKIAFFKEISANKFLKKLSIKTKMYPDSKMQEVFLDNNPLVYSIQFDYGKLTNDEFDEKVCQRLKSEYLTHEDEIKEQYRD